MGIFTDTPEGYPSYHEAKRLLVEAAVLISVYQHVAAARGNPNLSQKCAEWLAKTKQYRDGQAL
jgi:hypothetical protein